MTPLDIVANKEPLAYVLKDGGAMPVYESFDTDDKFYYTGEHTVYLNPLDLLVSKEELLDAHPEYLV